MATLSLPTNTPAIDGAVIGCTTDDTNGTAYAMVRTGRQWYSVANGDSQALADADKATIIAQDITATELVWAGTDTDLATIQATVDGLPESDGPFYVGWVQDSTPTGYGESFAMDFLMGAGETLTLPFSGTLACNVDWGDGSDDDYVTGNTVSHDYTAAGAGTYTVQVTGAAEGFAFNNIGDRLKLTGVHQLGTLGMTVTRFMFYGCRNLVFQDAAETDVVTVSGFNMEALFRDCYLLERVNLTPFAASTPTRVNRIINNCRVLVTADLSMIDTSAAIQSSECFTNCYLLETLNLTGWDLSGSSTLYYFCDNCRVLNNIIGGIAWSLSATDYRRAFYHCEALAVPSLASWGIASIAGVSGLENIAAFTLGLTTTDYDATLISWDTGGVGAATNTSFGPSIKTLGGAAEAAYDSLEVKGLAITDGHG